MHGRKKASPQRLMCSYPPTIPADSTPTVSTRPAYCLMKFGCALGHAVAQLHAQHAHVLATAPLCGALRHQVGDVEGAVRLGQRTEPPRRPLLQPVAFSVEASGLREAVALERSSRCICIEVHPHSFEPLRTMSVVCEVLHSARYNKLLPSARLRCPSSA